MADIGDYRFVVHKTRLHTVNRLNRFGNYLLDSLEENNTVLHDMTISRQKHSKKATTLCTPKEGVTHVMVSDLLKVSRPSSRQTKRDILRTPIKYCVFDPSGSTLMYKLLGFPQTIRREENRDTVHLRVYWEKVCIEALKNKVRLLLEKICKIQKN